MAAQPSYPARGKGDGLKDAWSAPSNGGSPNHPSRPPAGGDGLKQAWANQTSKPSVLTDMAAAKRKVR